MKSHKCTMFAALALLFCVAAQGKPRQIKNVQTVTVSCPQGHAPRLPWAVWVTYTDGSGEWRQTRWANSGKQAEQEQAAIPAGAEYTVDGYVIGDSRTAQGYPIQASVTVTTAVPDAPSVVAEPLPLAAVSVTGDNRLATNQARDIDHLLSLDLGQQLYNYRDTYGLPTEGYTESDGWDSPTTKLKGHGTGHYLSALAMAYASAPVERKLELKGRIAAIVRQMDECQQLTFTWCDTLGRHFMARDVAPDSALAALKGTWDAFDDYKQDCAHYGYGYINAIPPQHLALIEMMRPYNNELWVWAPYYTVHKQLAGLIDVALNVDDRQLAADALRVARLMGLWVWDRLHHRTTPQQRRQMWNMYIAGEVGGMAESLARLAELTADTAQSARLLQAATYFDAPTFFDPLAHNIDDIRTRHANQHIPMVTGALRLYRAGGGDHYYHIASNFWHMVQGRYAYATGGVGNGEMWREPYSQMLSMNTNAQRGRGGVTEPNPEINETCCAYNLAKLTKELNCFTPDDASLMDYYERVLCNQIVGSLSPDEWAVTYQYAVGLAASKPFGNETPQSSCCGGTGVENHVKYPEAAYFANDTCLWVCLYMPTRAVWGDVTITQSCDWPAESSRITLDGGGEFTVKLRVPWWATSGFEVRVNGRRVATSAQPSSYLSLHRQWSPGDVIDIDMPFATHIYYGHDKMSLALTADGQTPFQPMWLGALMLGPMVMASPDVTTWAEAEVCQQDIRRQGMSLTLDGRTFLPDYAVTGPCTHYLRLAQPQPKGKRGKADTSSLLAAMALAEERTREPEAWAPHGLARLTEKLTAARELLEAKRPKQDEVNVSAAALDMALCTMRPSNLAEPEDLAELIALLASAKDVADKSPDLRSAIDYADMVTQYVNSGSGTPDMIVRATHRLRQAREGMGK